MRRTVGRSDGRTEGWRWGQSVSPTVRLSVGLLAACNPVTTRPVFMPFPEAPSVVLYARPQRVATEV